MLTFDLTCVPQVAGGTAFLGQKGEKGEPAVIEPVSQSHVRESTRASYGWTFQAFQLEVLTLV